MIIFTRIPKRGDIVVGELATKKVKYIPLSVFVFDEINADEYEIIGVVGTRRGNQVLIVYKANEELTLCNNNIDISCSENIYHRNGDTGNGGSVSVWKDFVIDYRYRESRLKTDVTSISLEYPISLTDYLGNSPDGIDHCEWLRGVFGLGEGGWLKHLESFIPVKCDYGVMGMDVSYAMKVKSLMKDSVNSPAFNYIRTIKTECIPNEEWYLPTVRDLSDILFDVTYLMTPLTGPIDALNKGLELIKGSLVSYGYNWWSCCFFKLYSAWYTNVSPGYFSLYGTYRDFKVLPVSLQKLSYE